MIDVIYLNGGKGIRAGLGYPKQFTRLAGKPIMIYGLEVLDKIKEINQIIIPSSYIDTTIILLEQYQIKNFKIIENGENRQMSVYNALGHVNTKHVLIMESVRPFINIEFVENIINIDSDFVVPISRSLATVLTRDGKVIDRDQVGQVQMPQKYLKSLLIDCHNKAFNRNQLEYTDDAALVISESDSKPYVIDGLEQNIKITTPLDLRIMEGLFKGADNE
jgi:2-C-methyl-D-erythritol 4-phosphate cytidylyltransferase